MNLKHPNEVKNISILFQIHPPIVETSTMAVKDSKQEKCVMFDFQQLTHETLLGAAGKSWWTKME